jgi:hypothetical protein
MRQFVPMTDEMLYSADGPPGPLVPYRFGVPCQRDSAAVQNPMERTRSAVDSPAANATDAATAALTCRMSSAQISTPSANAGAET